MAPRLPSRKHALALLKKKNPDNIVRHSVKVSEVAAEIALQLKNNQTKVNPELTETAALLHDLDKYESLTKGFDFNKNVLNLRKKGFRVLAKTILDCQLDSFLGSSMKNKSIEALIIQYADKRVLHDKKVSLDKRFDYLFKRYGHVSPEILLKLQKAEKSLKSLEVFLKKKGMKIKP